MHVDTDRPLRGRRLTWAEFEQLTGRKRPASIASKERTPVTRRPNARHVSTYATSSATSSRVASKARRVAPITTIFV